MRYTQEYIEKHVTKASHLLFINSVICPQENTQSFIKQTAQNRKDIILEIIRASDYDEYHEKAKKFLKDKTNEAGLLNTERIEKENFRDSNLQLIQRKPQINLMIEASAAELEALKIEKHKLDEEKEKDTANRIKLAELQKSFDFNNANGVTISNNIKSIDSYLSAANVGDVQSLKEQVALLEIKKSDYAKLSVLKDAATAWSVKKININSQRPSEWQIDSLKKETLYINERIIALMSGGAQCVLQHEHCPSVKEEIQKSIDFNAKSLAEKDGKLKEYESISALCDAQIAELGESPVWDSKALSDLEGEIEKLRPAVTQLAVAERAEKTIQEKVIEKENLMASLNKVREDSAKYASEIALISSNLRTDIQSLAKAVEDKINLNNYTLSGMRKELEIIAQIEPAYDVAVKRIDEIDKLVYTINNDTLAVSAVKEAFGNSGIKSIMVDFVLPELEGRINDVLEKMSDFRITIETQKDSADGESLIDGLFLTITNGQGETFDLANYSGGEKMKINMAISEGLASLQQVGFRVLDESITGLDNSTVESFMEILETIQSRFSQLICISHLPAVKDMFADKINVVKLNGDSVIK